MQQPLTSKLKARVHTVLGIQPTKRRITSMFAPVLVQGSNSIIRRKNKKTCRQSPRQAR
jgi:hypothetical protein